jgi:hypothetical protein
MCSAAQCRTCVATVVVALQSLSPLAGLQSCMCGLFTCIKPLCVPARVGVQSCLLLQAQVTHWLCISGAAGQLLACFSSWRITVSQPAVQFGAALLQLVALSCDRVHMVLCAGEHRGKPHWWRLSVPRACTFCTGLHQPRSCTHVCLTVSCLCGVCALLLRGCTQCAFVHVLPLLRADIY